MNDFDNKQICSYKDIDKFGFTCDVCGRKVNGCSIVNGMKFCAKCYQETFGKDNQQNEIQQLKQQLEEKDKLLKCYQEEEKLIADILGDKDLTLIGSRVHLKNLIVELKNKIKDKDIVIEEKDKEISRLKERLSVIDNFKDNYGYTNYDDREILEDLQSRAFQAEDDTQVVDELLQFFNIFDENELVDKVKEPQTQLAIQELEKVKNFIDGRTYCADYINKRIQELKGE